MGGAGEVGGKEESGCDVGGGRARRDRYGGRVVDRGVMVRWVESCRRVRGSGEMVWE